MNMQLRQCFGRANPDFSGYFNFQKKPKVFKKSQNFKIWLQKIQFGNPATQGRLVKRGCRAAALPEKRKPKNSAKRLNSP